MGWLRGLTVNEIVRCVTRPGVGLWWGVSGFSGGLVPCDGVRSCFSRVFDTPVDALFSNGSRVVHEGPGCVDRRCAVGLSLAARHGGLASEIGAACWCGGGLRTQERICTTSL